MRRIVAFIFLIFSDNLLAIQLQERDSWSWVSSIQDVISQAGIDQSQTEVATRLINLQPNKLARNTEIVTLVNLYGLTAWIVDRPGSPNELSNTLAKGWRMIAFVRPYKSHLGHFIVLQGFDHDGNIIYSDPLTGQTNAQSPQALYEKWRWSDPIIVDK